MSKVNKGVNYRFVSSINTEEGDVANKTSFFGEVVNILEDEIAVLKSTQTVRKANNAETLRKLEREVSNTKTVLENSYREVNPKRIKTSSSRTVEAKHYIEAITAATKSLASSVAAVTLFTEETKEKAKATSAVIKQKVDLMAELLG